MKDSETEVKASALKALNAVINKLSSDKVTSQIAPTLRGLNNKSNKDTKSNIGLLFIIWTYFKNNWLQWFQCKLRNYDGYFNER